MRGVVRLLSTNSYRTGTSGSLSVTGQARVTGESPSGSVSLNLQVYNTVIFIGEPIVLQIYIIRLHATCAVHPLMSVSPA